MANNITVENLNISGTLSANEIITGKISSGPYNTQDLSAALQALSKLPKNPVKTINGIPAGEDGNVQLAPIDQSYTAFEVYPTSALIPAGTVDKYIGQVHVEIPASRTMAFALRCWNDKFPIRYTKVNGTITVDEADYSTQVDNFLKECDIVIDWGDGVIQSISADWKTLSAEMQMTHSRITQNPWAYPYEQSRHEETETTGTLHELGFFIKHDYALEKCNKTYIVKIYGKSYFEFGRYYTDAFDKNNVITSKILTRDLPIRSDIESLYGITDKSLRLTSVDADPMLDLTKISHIYRAFNACTNLQTVKGLNGAFKILQDSNYMFAECENLKLCDLKLPSVLADNITNNAFAGVFKNCKKIEGYFEDFLPDRLVNLSNITGSGMFSNCEKLKIRDIDDLASHLWTAPEDIRIKTASMFDGCDETTVRDYIPKAFGGTSLTDFKTLLQRIVELEAKVAALEAQQ